MKQRHRVIRSRFERGDVVYVAWMIACLAPIYVTLWFAHLQTLPSSIRQRHDLRLLDLPRADVADPAALPVAVQGVYGDIFEPNAGNTSRSYDVIVISATLDPVSKVGDMIEWESNRLVRESLRQAAVDPAVADTMIDAVISRMMTTNRLFIENILKAPVERLNDPYIPTLCNPYFEPVPPSSLLGRKGIRYLAVVPLFKPAANGGPDTKIRLQHNVRIAVGRVINRVNLREKVDHDYEIFGIAFPALAGTEGRLDSDDFLTYRESFHEIVSGVMGRQLPSSVEGVYLVAWNQLEHEIPAEGLAAVDALVSVYASHAMRQSVAVVVGNLIVAAFCAAFVLGWLRRPWASAKDVLTAALAAGVVWLVTDFADKYVKATAHLGDVIAAAADHSGYVLVLLLTAALSFAATAIGLSISRRFGTAATDHALRDSSASAQKPLL